MDRKTNMEMQSALWLMNAKRAIVVFVNMASPESQVVEVNAEDQYFENTCSKTLNLFFNAYFIVKATVKNIIPYKLTEVCYKL